MSRWCVYRTVEHVAPLTLRLRARGRWLGPAILCTSIESARRHTPAGLPLVRFT